MTEKPILDELKNVLADNISDAGNFERIAFPDNNGGVFTNGICHPEVYIWDAWTDVQDDHITMYTLASPRIFYQNDKIDLVEQRDFLPHHWRRFESPDAGLSWIDHGVCMTPRLGTDYFDSRSIWTGSIMEHEGKWIAGYTGIRDMGNELQSKLQALGLAVRNADGTFNRLTDKPFSCPLRDYQDIRHKGYYLGPLETLGNHIGEEGSSILAWRDPYLVKDKSGVIHAFWGAKENDNGEQRSAIGHGTLTDPLGECKFTLLPPIRLPHADDFTEAEVPQVKWCKDEDCFYMMISTTNKYQGIDLDKDLCLTVRIYRAESLNDTWQAVHCEDITDTKTFPGVFFDVTHDDEDNTIIRYTSPYGYLADDTVKHTLPAVKTLSIKSSQ